MKIEVNKDGKMIYIDLDIGSKVEFVYSFHRESATIVGLTKNGYRIFAKRNKVKYVDGEEIVLNELDGGQKTFYRQKNGTYFTKGRGCNLYFIK
jgi:hypothetical protein